MSTDDLTGDIKMREFEKVPGALQELVGVNRWVNWIRQSRADGSYDKPPTDAGGRKIGVNRAENWQTFSDAIASVQAGKTAGIGFVPAAEGEFLFLDLDDCLRPDTGEMVSEVADLIVRAGTYAEISPSGAGVRIIGYKDGWAGGTRKKAFRLPGGGCSGEIYTATGYVTVTFDAIAGAEGPLKAVGWLANEIVERSVRDKEAWSGEWKVNADKTAPIEVVREVLGEIPNAERVDWTWWKETIGFAVWAACEGSDEGYTAWLEWSRQNAAFDEDATAEAWERMCVSPPEHRSFGTLVHEARVAGGEGWTGGPAWQAWSEERKVGRAVAGLGVLPVIEGVAGRPRGATGDGRLPRWGGSGGLGGGSGADIGGGGIDRPVVTVSAELGEMVAFADLMLAETQPVWRKGGRLVTWNHQQFHTLDGEDVTLIGLGPLDEAQLKVFLSNSIIWQRVEKRGRPKKKEDGKKNKVAGANEDCEVNEGCEVDENGNRENGEENVEKEEIDFVRCMPPADVTRALLFLQGLRPIKNIAGVVATPTLRYDGSLIDTVGYDSKTRLLYMPDKNLRLPEGWNVPHVDIERARDSLALLDSLLENFGFEGEKDSAQYNVNRTVALSALLTPIARNMMDVAPGHAFTARSVSSGKSLLVNLASKIALGTSCPAAGAAISIEETEKALTGLALRGLSIIALDNVNAELRSDLLCRMLSQEMLTLRALGRSDVFDVENRYSFYATGNNMTLTGDLIRRVLPCRLDVGEERPYNKRYAFNPLDRVAEDRGRYVAAALDVIRAFVLAGRPGAETLVPLASYEAWTRTVRGALVWLGRPDPVLAMENAREDDPDVTARREMLKAWVAKFGVNAFVTVGAAAEAVLNVNVAATGSPEGEGFADKVVQLEGWQERQNGGSVFREVMLRRFGERNIVNVRSLGRWLSRAEGVVQDGLKFVKRPGHGVSPRWGVQNIDVN